MFNIEIPESIQVVLKFFAQFETPSPWEAQLRSSDVFKNHHDFPSLRRHEEDVESINSFLSDELLVMNEAFDDVRILHIQADDIEDLSTSPVVCSIGTIVAQRGVEVTVTSSRWTGEDSENEAEFEVSFLLVRLMRGTERRSIRFFSPPSLQDTSWRVMSLYFWHNGDRNVEFG